MALLDHVEQVAKSDWRNSVPNFRMPYVEDLTTSQRLRISKQCGPEALLELASPEFLVEINAGSKRRSRNH